MNSKGKTAISLILAALLLTACGCNPARTVTITLDGEAQTTTSPGVTGARQIIIQNGVFEPMEITINTGDTITWINNDSENRSITSWREDREADGWRYANIGDVWDSGGIMPGQTYSRTFTQPGRFEYFSFPMYLYGDFQKQPLGVITVE